MPETSAHAAATQLLGGVAGSQGPRQQSHQGGVPAASAERSPTNGRRTYLSLKQVGLKFGVGERTAHKLISEPWMPPPIELRPRLHRWIEDEIDAAVAARAPRRVERAAEPERLARGRAARSQAVAA